MPLSRLLRVDWHVVAGAVQSVARQAVSLEESVGRHEVVVIGPKRLREEFLRFARGLRGDVVWYHACSRLFHRQELFDATVGVLLGNDDVSSVQFLADERDRGSWENEFLPRLAGHPAAAKVRTPLWGQLAGGVSFIVGEVGEHGEPEALVGILEEPFAARTGASTMPRYVLRIQNDSELLDHFVELARHAANVFESGREIALRPEDLLRSPAVG